MPVDRLTRIVGQVNAQHPDAVLIAGDLVNGVTAHSPDFHPDEIVAPLSRLRAPLGVIAVLGNHDVETSSEEVSAALGRAGVNVLHDQAMRLGPIALIGISRPEFLPSRLPPLIAQAQKLGGPLVMMIHPPPFAGEISHRIPVILAGHSHCGQIVFPGWDNSYDIFHRNLRYPPETRCGLVRYDQHLEIVTGGLGAATIVPLRINAPPDFWMITFVGRR
jgi:predicted MPP superfamily phosphohydrolase